ncbi:hypothetical protein K0M31_020167 [Melipona bicolor]|uniref:Uncharacterized protein n=1 Tax=Melipona bicolor TaxID=60889 RepID=A0AA40G0X9_9HYME|nr:hypothetical protein K0M31_020167 [Melipona bicolor]
MFESGQDSFSPNERDGGGTSLVEVNDESLRDREEMIRSVETEEEEASERKSGENKRGKKTE